MQVARHDDIQSNRNYHQNKMLSDGLVAKLNEKLSN